MKKHKQSEILAHVFEHTLQCFKIYPYDGSWFRISEELTNDEGQATKSGEISVQAENCLDVAHQLVKQGFSVGMINMANAHHPGGGIKKGSKAQEEDLCRCSNLYDSLSRFLYPMKEFECFVSKDVEFFKDKDYQKIKPWKCTILSISAYRLDSPKKFTSLMYEGTKRKIRILLKAALEAGVTHLVLSALGCGAFSNPPELVAQAFKDVLIAEGLNRCFDAIVFAIIDDGTNNYKIFKQKIIDQH
jgi:uncharacterized protein (TIGR02452 family)